MHNYFHGGSYTLCDDNDEDTDNDENATRLHIYND